MPSLSSSLLLRQITLHLQMPFNHSYKINKPARMGRQDHAGHANPEYTFPRVRTLHTVPGI